MRKLLPLLSLLLLGADAPPQALPFHVVGRVVPNGEALDFGWPGTYFETRFKGSALRVRVAGSSEHFRLLINGVERAVIRGSPEADLTISWLDDGTEPQIARLEKLTESQTGGGTFLGFSLPEGGEALPLQPRSRRIEFIGDSYTVGYGNRSTKRECTRDEVHDLTDTQQAFGPLLAKRLDADYRVTAYSGFGIARNYNGSSPELNLPIIYPRSKPDLPTERSRPVDSWQPQLIVINLGTNDFSTPLHAGERWKSDAELRAEYRGRYTAFVRGLRNTYPRAAFILMGSDKFIADVEQVARSLDRQWQIPVKTVQFGDLDLMGCDWHPSLADHRRLADLLQRQIGDLPQW